MMKDKDPLRVVKKLAPTQPGAIKLARKYGEALLCVRYRNEQDDSHRITTVELIIDRTPIQRRAARTVEVVLDFRDRKLRQLAIAAGASWDGEAKVWRMTERVAGELGLLPTASNK